MANGYVIESFALNATHKKERLYISRAQGKGFSTVMTDVFHGKVADDIHSGQKIQKCKKKWNLVGVAVSKLL